MAALLTSIAGLTESANDLATDVESFRYWREPLVDPAENWEGEVFSQVTQYRGTVGAWQFRTPTMTRAEADNLVSSILEQGKRAITGELVGGTVQVHVRGASLVHTKRPDEFAVVHEYRETLAVGGDFREHLRVLVADAAGDYVDQTRHFVSGSGSSSVEQIGDSASLTFLRESAEGSLNPEIRGPDGPFANGRGVKLQFARVEAGEELQASDWWWLFAGTMRGWEGGGNQPFMKWKAMDYATHLLLHQISGVERYGNAAGTMLKLAVLQSMFDREIPTRGYTVVETGTASEQGYLLFDQAEVSFDRAVTEVTKLDGSVFKMLLNSSGDPVPTTWLPNRDQTVPDQSFSEGEYYEIVGMGRSLDGIRNEAEVRFALDSEGLPQPGIISIAEDSDDPDPRRIIFDMTMSPLVTTAQQAGAIGTLALQDLANAPLSHRVHGPLVPVSLTELIEWAADNVHYDVPQKAAVVQRDWTLGQRGNDQLVSGSVKPRGSTTRWLMEENWRYQRGIVVPDDLTVTLDPDDIAGHYTIPTASAHYEDEGIISTSHGKFGSTTPVPLQLNNVFRKITEAEKASGITLYALIWHPNRSTDLIDWENVKGRFNRLGSGGISFAAAPDPAGIVASDGTTEFLTIASETVAPLDGGNPLAWVSPDSWEHEDVLEIGTVTAVQGFATWFRLVVEAGATGQVTDEAWLYAQFAPEEE